MRVSTQCFFFTLLPGRTELIYSSAPTKPCTKLNFFDIFPHHIVLELVYSFTDDSIMYGLYNIMYLGSTFKKYMGLKFFARCFAIAALKFDMPEI